VQPGESAGNRADFFRRFKTGAAVFLHDDGVVRHGLSKFVVSTDVSHIAGQNDDIVVRISDPALSVVCARVYKRPFDNFGAKRAGLRYRSVKRAQLKPEQNTKTMGRRACVAKVHMVMNVPRVKLKNHLAVAHNLLVFGPAVTALATKQLLVPPAAAFHVAHGDQRLGFHR
jgi:hypothetical protein